VTGSKAPALRRIPPGSSAFIRLLSDLNDMHPSEPDDAFAERLSRWFAWTDAISLSGALGPAPAAPDGFLFVESDAHEVARVRGALTRLVEGPTEPANKAPARRIHPAPPPQEPSDDFATWRRRYVAAQQAMETRIEPLRRRLRASLEGGTPAQARLAALDAVLEKVVGEREYELLAGVPSLLERHFDRLRRAHEDRQPPADVPAPDAPPPRSRPAEWLDVFSRSMRAVLLAELDLRLQPVDGLLEALRSSRDS
jgi:hypothetical protein